MITEGCHYLIDETENAYCVEKNKKNVSKNVVLDIFAKECSSDDVKRAFCQVDRDSDEMVKYGMTTFGVETKGQQLFTIGIHENNYESCKDELMQLQNCVKRAEAKLSDKKDTIMMNIKKFAITAAIVAGGISLIKMGIDKKMSPVDPVPETTTEQTTEEVANNDMLSYDEISNIQVLPNMQKTVEKQVAEEKMEEAKHSPMAFFGEEDRQQDVSEDKQTYPYTDDPIYTKMYEGIDFHTPEGRKQADEVAEKINELKSEAYMDALREDYKDRDITPYHP